MLDLKAKLAAAGLVSEQDVAKAEARRKKKRKKGSRGAAPSTRGKPGVRPLNVAALADVSKNELYAAVRRWVEQARLDAQGVPSETTRPFHFPELSGRIGRLMVEPALAETISRGEAAVIAFMSNSGIAHAVVPAAGARDLARLRESWLRVLKDDPRAGAIEKDSSSC